MISDDKAAGIRDALFNGTPQRKIAREFGVSTRTVHRIASQRRSEFERDEQEEEKARRARRCPGCGWLVYQWPCLNCLLQDQQSTESSR